MLFFKNNKKSHEIVQYFLYYNRITKYVFIVMILMENDILVSLLWSLNIFYDLLTFYKTDVQLMFYLTKEMEGM